MMGKKISKSVKLTINLGNYENVVLTGFCEVDVDDYDDEDEAMEDMKDTVVESLADGLQEVRDLEQSEDSFIQDYMVPKKKRKR